MASLHPLNGSSSGSQTAGPEALSPLAPLLEPESLCFGAPTGSARRMVARVTLRDGRRSGFYAALLEEVDDGSTLRITDLVHDLIVGELTRVEDGDTEVTTYAEEVGDELRSVLVAWSKGTATETTSRVRLSWVA